MCSEFGRLLVQPYLLYGLLSPYISFTRPFVNYLQFMNAQSTAEEPTKEHCNKQTKGRD